MRRITQLSLIDILTLTPWALRYLNDTQLTLYRERFVRAQSDCYLHVGNVTTSRVEGAHAIVKNYIGGTACDILDVQEGIDNTLSTQYTAIIAATPDDRI